MVMIGRIIFCPGPFMHQHLQHIHLWFQRKHDSNGECPEGPVLPWQIDAQISTNSCQIGPNDPQEHEKKLQAPCYYNFPERK